MKIGQAEYVISAVGPAQYPKDGLPEIALAGRSNVGKSSFINKMLGRRNLVRISEKPGKTQKLNYFKINGSFYFVDVPGYGYAKVSKKEKEAWGKMLEAYFSQRNELSAVVHLVDLRHPPSKEDRQMHDYLSYFGRPIVTVATKADKVSKNRHRQQKQLIIDDLGLGTDEPLLLFSSVTGAGKDDAWRALEPFLK
ncbi:MULTISPECIES: ribosome biogenesis GTP-binding protein YihA/YsxC [unclassified Sporolactobacillus]|uniref:ribosome biogenesis GTP-binding protein YihA/YsxC n=1 Tax=unclassified Sporolactobacillus TaxID=2628533 RepID=UPI0023687B02|nr:ribosome biogenesis GTP-binding protein YihA/YsxC [Sporolactobacillus sp. CQH2019]MDD9147713.1 ribosome biogenesis GTP-binding protein YihA/YsxC [Sporolactobacillus sp. CQH2019]